MKNRAPTLAFTACLANSLAFADNPTDASLLCNNGDTTVVRQKSFKDRTSDERHDKKDNPMSLIPNTLHTISVKTTQSNPEYPAHMNH